MAQSTSTPPSKMREIAEGLIKKRCWCEKAKTQNQIEFLELCREIVAAGHGWKTLERFREETAEENGFTISYTDVRRHFDRCMNGGKK